MTPREAIKKIRNTRGPLFVWTVLFQDDGAYVEAKKADVIWHLETHCDANATIPLVHREGDGLYVN